MTNREKYAYLAGIIDGEGCICIRKCYTTIRKNPDYFTELTIVNTDKSLMDWLKDNFGGSVTIRRSKNARHKSAYAWRTSRRAAMNILVAVRPYMVVKKDRADLAIALEMPKKMGDTRSVNKSTLSVREKIRLTVKLLNAHGPVPVR